MNQVTTALDARPLLSIVFGCFNEAENIPELYERTTRAISGLTRYRFELIFIDNASTDDTVAKIKGLCASDRRVKLIVNARNFGHIRSPMHAVFQAEGAAVIGLASDLEDPPELIPQFVSKWEEGYRIVVGVKAKSADSLPMRLVRSGYYWLVESVASTRMIRDMTGFGLYDRSVVEIIRGFEDPYPYFRGQLSEIGFPVATIPFDKPHRPRGITKNNFFTLYDLAMLGITSHSKAPIRAVTLVGFLLALIAMLVALGYLVAKLLFWETFQFGLAPVLIGFFFFSSVQLFVVGLVGEYVAAIHTQVMRRPLVIEQERVNFEPEQAGKDHGRRA